jgi:DUF1680 family protein
VRRVFADGDVVRLDLPVAPRLTAPDPRIDAVRGCLAVEQGPLVLALESTDLPDGLQVDQVRLDAGTAPWLVDGTVHVRAVHADAADEPWPYGGPAATLGAAFEVPLVAYHYWANRGRARCASGSRRRPEPAVP